MADLNDLFSALADSFTPEQMALSTLQGTIAAEITMKRLDLDMNQTQFARHMGVSQGLISRWETGETNFTLQTLVEIASKLDIKLQSPFVLTPSLPYQCEVSKIVTFPGPWHGGELSNSGYDSYALKEM